MSEVIISAAPAIEINNLEMVYTDLFGNDKVRALDGISFEVRRGEIFGFLGPNGAGKTTTIHNLMNFIFPTAGEAKIFGLSVNDHRCRRRVGFLPELFAFDKFLKGKRLMEYLGTLSGLSKAEIFEEGKELLDFFDMKEALNRKVKNYSKGMTQKIGLAQAMMGDPDLLILDEPTSGMDPIAKTKIKHRFLELKKRGKTVFLSTHILSDVQQIADRVAIINKGKLIKIDTVENLLRRTEETEIMFSIMDDKAATLKPEWNTEKKNDSAYMITVTDKQVKAEIIATLSDLKADIISVTPRSMELEEIFMQLVEDAD
jgi:ABC-2 type transport system ATP-binding protein